MNSNTSHKVLNRITPAQRADITAGRLMGFEFDLTTRLKDGRDDRQRETYAIAAHNELDAKVRLKQVLHKDNKEVVVAMDFACYKISVITKKRVLVEFKEEVPVGKSSRIKHNSILAAICEKHSLNIVAKKF